MPAFFFQKYWYIIDSFVSDYVLRFLNDGALLDSFHHTHIVLIPKCTNSESTTQFRPINNRLKPCMSSLIAESQSAFVPDRIITANVLVAYEINHFIKKSNNKGKKYLSLKLDMSKTYDRVEWCFLE